MIFIDFTAIMVEMMPLSAFAQVKQGLAMSGRGAGTRSGGWRLRMAAAGDVANGWLELDGLREIGIQQNPRTERHLLKPFDILVAARGDPGRAALVPPGVSRTVAGVTLLVARPHDPGSGMGHFLWYYLTSAFGTAQMQRQTLGSALPLLTARNLAQVKVPLPSPRELDLFANLIEASEEAYASAIEAARLRREALRNALINDIINKEAMTS